MVLIPEEKKLSIIRKYPLEAMVVLLIMALGWSTWQQVETNKKVDRTRDHVEEILVNDKEGVIRVVDDVSKVVEKNTSVIDRNNSLIEANTLIITALKK